jgi:hypothetical protein
MSDGQNSGNNWGCWLVAVIAIIGVAIIYQRDGGKVFGPGGVAGNNPQDTRKTVPLRCARSYTRDNGVNGSNRYVFQLEIFHRADVPLSGRYIVRAFGDVFGNGGENSPEGSNYAFLDVVNDLPGESGGIKTRFYVNNAFLKNYGLDSEFVEATAFMKIQAEFIPSGSSEKDWKKTFWEFEVNKGKYLEYQR